VVYLRIFICFLYSMLYKIPFEIIPIDRRDYHLFLDIFIHNKSCRLLIDTGASKTVFDTERILRFINEKNLNTIESKTVGLGVSNMETKIAILKRIHIGKLMMKTWSVAVLPIGHVNELYQTLEITPIDGVLGSDFLMKHNAIINFRTKTLTLSKKVIKKTIA